MKIVIVIPTYNESENVSRLIPLIDIELKKFPNHDFNVLIVDGNSPDGTGDVVKSLATKYPYVILLTEKEKAGLGAAYIYGFKHAILQLGAEAIVEMDADMQHRPEDLTAMIHEFDNGYDYVIGSRYIRGGSIPKEWAFYRKLLSIGGNIFTKVALGIYNVSDFTTGFKISRVKGFVDKMNLDEVNSSGFAYKMDLLFRMYKLGAKIKEVPIQFGLRDRGNSKMERDNMFDSLRVVAVLRFNASKSFFKFVITGFVGLFVDTGLFTILRSTIFSSPVASAVSGFIAMVTTYTINNLWSFNTRKLQGAKKTILSFFIYFGFSYVPIIFRSWLIKYAVSSFGNTFIITYSAFFIGILFGLIWNYTVYSRVIWKKKL